jgi:archaellum component FlaC
LNEIEQIKKLLNDKEEELNGLDEEINEVMAGDDDE